MYSYYMDRGKDLEKLINLNYLEKQFHIAAMEVNREEKINQFGI